jgi:SAM-dependent methyltransferase
MQDATQVKVYREAADHQGAFESFHVFILIKLAQRLKPGMRVVDLCCGPCDLLCRLARLYPSVTFVGVDLSEEMLEAADQKRKSLGLHNLELVLDDVSSLKKLSIDSFDLAMSTVALHHLPTTLALNQCFAQTARILKANGQIFFADFRSLKNKTSVEGLIEVIAKNEDPMFQFDFAESLRAAFDPCDFTVALQGLHSKNGKIQLTCRPVLMMAATELKPQGIRVQLQKWGELRNLNWKQRAEVLLMMFLFRNV